MLFCLLLLVGMDMTLSRAGVGKVWPASQISPVADSISKQPLLESLCLVSMETLVVPWIWEGHKRCLGRVGNRLQF